MLVPNGNEVWEDHIERLRSMPLTIQNTCLTSAPRASIQHIIGDPLGPGFGGGFHITQCFKKIKHNLREVDTQLAVRRSRHINKRSCDQALLQSTCRCTQSNHNTAAIRSINTQNSERRTRQHSAIEAEPAPEQTEPTEPIEPQPESQSQPGHMNQRISVTDSSNQSVVKITGSESKEYKNQRHCFNSIQHLSGRSDDHRNDKRKK